jgi:hypothetical protein
MSRGIRANPAGTSGSEEDGAAMANQETKRSYLSELQTQLVVLTPDNFHAYQLSLIALEYFAKWDKDILDIKGDSLAAAWDGTEEDDAKTCYDRRMAYAGMRKRMSDVLKYLLEDIESGDARALFARLKKRYCSMTTGAISALTTEINNLSM